MASSSSSSSSQQSNDDSDNNNNLVLPRVDFDKTEIVASTKWMRLETLSYLVPNNNEIASQPRPQPPQAALRKWDRVVRTTKHSETSVDAVVILATLRHSIANNINNGSNSEKGDEIVCVKQYRPPINAFTLELPAGLIDLEDVTTTTNGDDDDDDDNDDNNLIQTQEAAVKSAALREFTEETGYIGTISSMTIGPQTYLSPGLTNECACLVKLDVDMTHEQNVRVYDNYMKGNIHSDHDDGGGGENRCENNMEESERERELTTVLFPKVGLLAALQEYVQRKNSDDGGRRRRRRENVKLFTGLYSLAVGMSIMEEEMKLLASSSSGGSMTAMTTTASTNLPSLSSPDTNPMLAASSTTTTTTDFPLVQLQFMDSNNNKCIPTKSTSYAITSALRTSGFVLIQSPTLFPLELQRRALSAARQFLESEKAILSNKVVSHPSDPKVYAMLQGMDSVCFVEQDDYDTATSTTTTTTTKQHDLPTSSLAHDAVAISASDTTILNDLKEWYKAMRQTRSVLLHCLAIGLGMSSSSSSSSSSEDDDDDNDDDDAQSYFNNLHQENNDALRLIKYHPGDDTTGNRCKEHSDYGTITLLLTDGVAGLEAHVNGKWRAVPYVEGSIVVNVGTLLSEWTRQELKATLHRVAGPASSDSCNTATEREVLMESVRRERISIAYFADPDVDVSVSLSTNTAAMMKKKEDGVLDNDEKRGIELMSVSDYIRWRSGGSGQDRSGVAFTSLEESRLGEAEGSGAK
ncbi:hypothetical protein ACHAXH_001130 [Discostella pseudostelligera]